ncbi:MAG: hypothetical protein DRJ10_08330 [Bacteroidetes bacterium]|nr:MAG: hypothetical protein DRJ10_08330 [Bacteroidota bacterium]
MSTPAIISIEKFPNFYLYKHWDGFPENTLGWLEDFNQRFIMNRGADENENQYKAAQLVRSSVFEGPTFHLDPSHYTGWGIVTDDNWYADYHYVLKLDGTVEVIDL